MKCTACNEAAAHRSHRRGLVDWFWNLLDRVPYRCQKCGARFYAYRTGEKSSKVRTPEEKRIQELRRGLKWKRSKRELIVYGTGLLVLVLLGTAYSLYFLKF